MSEYWFKPHRYGLGAAPSTWQGWAVLAAYIAAIFGIASWFEQNGATRTPELVIALAALTALMCFVAWRKTEGGWRWRWGDPD